MRSEGAGAGLRRGWTEAEFARRVAPSELPERMDEPCSKEVLAACLGDLERVNRMTGSYRPTIRFLERVAARHGGAAMHVVDVGSGNGDMLRVIDRWARRRGLAVRLTGIDLNPETVEIAREVTRARGLPEGTIAWRTGDAMAEASIEAPDVVVSSLVAHHLERTEVVRFLGWMERSARLGWLVSDLERQPGPARWFGVLAWVMRWHAFVRHDGPVSFRRAFRVADWEAMLDEAGVDREAVTIAKRFPARLCVERLR